MGRRCCRSLAGSGWFRPARWMVFLLLALASGGKDTVDHGTMFWEASLILIGVGRLVGLLAGGKFDPKQLTERGPVAWLIHLDDEVLDRPLNASLPRPLESVDGLADPRRVRAGYVAHNGLREPILQMRVARPSPMPSATSIDRGGNFRCTEDDQKCIREARPRISHGLNPLPGFVESNYPLDIIAIILGLIGFRDLSVYVRPEQSLPSCAGRCVLTPTVARIPRFHAEGYPLCRVSTFFQRGLELGFAGRSASGRASQIFAVWSTQPVTTRDPSGLSDAGRSGCAEDSGCANGFRRTKGSPSSRRCQSTTLQDCTTLCTRVHKQPFGYI